MASTPGVPAADVVAPTTTTTSVPSYLSSALPAATSAKPVKVFLVGDSIAGTLGVGLAQEAQPYHVQIVNEGTPGCSLSMQTQIKVLFYTVAPDAPCDVDNNPSSLLQTWRKWVDAYNPDVVVYVARVRPSTRRSATSGRTSASPASTAIWPTGTARPSPSSAPGGPASCC